MKTKTEKKKNKTCQHPNKYFVYLRTTTLSILDSLLKNIATKISKNLNVLFWDMLGRLEKTKMFHFFHGLNTYLINPETKEK